MFSARMLVRVSISVTPSWSPDMFLTLKTNRGKRYLYLMESIHVKGKRNCDKRIVKNYGRWEEVPEEIRRQYEDVQARKALTQQLESQARAEEFQKGRSIKDWLCNSRFDRI